MGKLAKYSSFSIYNKVRFEQGFFKASPEDVTSEGNEERNR